MNAMRTHKGSPGIIEMSIQGKKNQGTPMSTKANQIIRNITGSGTRIIPTRAKWLELQ